MKQWKRKMGLWLLGRGRKSPELEREALLEALEVPEEHPLLRAVHHLIDRQREELADMAGNPPAALHPTAVIHSAGGLEALKELKSVIEALRMEAREKRES